MVGPILYDGTGLPPTPHRRRLAPRPEPTVEPFTVTSEMVAVSPEFIALATGFPVEPEAVIIPTPVPAREAEPDETPAEAAQEPDQAPESESEAELPADTATGPVSGDKSTTEDAGAATLAALGL